MGFLASALAGVRAEKSAANFNIIRELLGTRKSASGKAVTVKTAIEVAAVCACVRVISEGIAQVPLKVMRETPDGKSRQPAKTHPLYQLLGTRPNDFQTSFEYREQIAMHAALCGNHFSFINRLGSGKIAELIPFEPGQVTVKQHEDWTLHYFVRGASGAEKEFPAAAIWHLRGPSWNGYLGLPAVQIAREAIGLSMAIEESQARMQKNGVRASGVYAVDGTLSDPQYKALKKWIDEEIGGAENAGKAMVLDRSAKWLNTSMTGIDAQLLETRRMQVEEICRFFRVNPIMVGAESKNTTYASAEQMFLGHVVHTLSPWYQRIEQSIDVNLLSEADRTNGVYSSFVDEGLLRGSLTNKKDILLGYVNGGLMTPNEGRAKLDLNPDTNPLSNQLRVPANIVGDSRGTPAPAGGTGAAK